MSEPEKDTQDIDMILKEQEQKIIQIKSFTLDMKEPVIVMIEKRKSGKIWNSIKK